MTIESGEEAGRLAQFHFALLKAPVVLYALHALEYPEQHPDTGIITDGALPMFGAVGEQYDLPERFIKDPQRKPSEKARWLCEQFLPVARFVLSNTDLEVGNTVSETKQILQQGLEVWGDAGDLRDKHSEPMTVDQIMPADRVVQAMLKSCEGEKLRRPRYCQPLVRFIGRAFRPDPEYPRPADA